MKLLSIIFIVLGVISNFIIATYYGNYGVVWLFTLFSLAAGIGMIISIYKKEKSIVVGIIGIIFTCILGGIFYLCWKPENE